AFLEEDSFGWTAVHANDVGDRHHAGEVLRWRCYGPAGISCELRDIRGVLVVEYVVFELDEQDGRRTTLGDAQERTRAQHKNHRSQFAGQQHRAAIMQPTTWRGKLGGVRREFQTLALH